MLRQHGLQHVLFKKEEDIVPEGSADKLYNEGLFLLNNKQQYDDAAKKFDQVDRENPYSDWARKALLMSAYSYYQGGNMMTASTRPSVT